MQVHPHSRSGSGILGHEPQEPFVSVVRMGRGWVIQAEQPAQGCNSRFVGQALRQQVPVDVIVNLDPESDHPSVLLTG